MNMHIKNAIQKSPLLAVGLLLTGLAACDSKPTEQASRDVDQIVNRAPSPAAGKEGSVVNPESKGMAGTGTAAATPATDDVALNIKVQDALKSDFALKTLPIIVQTTDGVVTLSGTAETPAQREQVAQVAMAVPGVKSVQNKLAVSGT